MKLLLLACVLSFVSSGVFSEEVPEELIGTWTEDISRRQVKDLEDIFFAMKIDEKVLDKLKKIPLKQTITGGSGTVTIKETKFNGEKGELKAKLDTYEKVFYDFGLERGKLTTYADIRYGKLYVQGVQLNGTGLIAIIREIENNMMKMTILTGLAESLKAELWFNKSN